MRILTLVLFLFGTSVVWDQAPPVTSNTPQVPVLTEVERLQLQNKFQQMQIAELELQRARSELLVLVKSLEKEGYDINLQTLTYIKKEVSKDK